MTESYTNPCKYYGSAAGCRWGYNCRDSHNNPESVALCRYFDGNCRYGNNCFFRHNVYETDVINMKSSKNNENDTRELCTYFNSPYGCSRKDKCRFKHVKQERPKPDDTLRLYSMNELTEMKLNIPQRQWRKITKTPKTDSNSSSSSELSLTIAQYNCLAQSLCYGVTDRVTFKCDKKYLVWEYRCKRILYEILQYKPDIICLQEIDNIHFKSFYFPNLSSQKYDGVFLSKNNIVINESQSHISLTDGIAIFWNTNKLSREESMDAFECVLGDKRECCQVALGVRLYTKEDKNKIFDVWNTHLKAGRTNESEDKRLKQCQILKDYMREYSYKIPVIFCGDFNLHFDPAINSKGIVVKNDAYKYLTNTKFNDDENELKEDDHDNDYKLMFKSLWNDKERNRFSSFAGWKNRDVKACFDYIMIGGWSDNTKRDKIDDDDKDFFVVKEILNGFEEKDIEKYECRLPNQNYSSDHMLIAAKVAIQVEIE